MSKLKQIIDSLGELAKRSHYSCEDGWYSCPKSLEGSLNEGKGNECDCGAEEHNKKVQLLLDKAETIKVSESEAERVLREWGDAIRKYDSTVDRSGEVQIGCPDAWMNERQAGDKAYLLARKLAGGGE